MQTLPYFKTTDINPLQENIMRFIDTWIRTEKTLVPQREIIAKMEEEGRKSFTVANALTGLLRKGYIRRANTSRKVTLYVQLRSV
ncbi:hypothetical protein HY357_02795 [Candidatus Roizmanbacteria bacterium]|nr:hypothetical protein [Candidatus Roizmanbacteria bacterium]